jgi:hypothetical protein
MSLKDVAEIAEIVGAVAAVLAAAWGFVTYGLDRVVGLRVRGKSEWRAADGIRVEIANLSRKRSVQVVDVEVLHSPGLFRRRVAIAAGPGSAPQTPWEIDPDRRKVGWIPLNAVDGSQLGSVAASWDFSKSVRLRAKLATGRSRLSRRFRIERHEADEPVRQGSARSERALP